MRWVNVSPGIPVSQHCVNTVIAPLNFFMTNSKYMALIKATLSHTHNHRLLVIT